MIGIKKLAIIAATLAVTVGPARAGNWWETIKFKGDFRYRHEMISEENKDARHRQRIRARIGIFGEVSPYTKVGIQLATGSSDPVSTNQTLDGAFSTKPVGIDLAYMEIEHEKLRGVTLLGGKFANPFFKPGSSELIWDSDWNPEGGSLKYVKEAENFDLTLIGAGLWIYERSSGKDSWLGAIEGVGRFHFNDKKTSLAVGGSYFNYVNTQGYQPFYDAEDAMGNSTVTVENDGETSLLYANDYELVEVFGEFHHKFEKTPMTVMVDYVTNTAADSLNTGWLAGLKLGKASKPGSWEFRYIYGNVEADAVVGIFADSDFRGGGTDAKGHEIGGGLALAQNTFFDVTYFMNEIGLQADNPSDFQRLQVDLQLKF